MKSVLISFDLFRSLRISTDIVRTVNSYDSYLFDNFGLKYIQDAKTDIGYKITDESKFTLFMLQYSEFIHSIGESYE